MCKARGVPPEPPGTDRLRIGFDATPLLGRPTGIGAFCEGALGGLAERTDLAVTAFAVSWRRRHGIDHSVPPGVTIARRPMPARPLHASWGRRSWPPLEWFTGPLDVVHGGNYVVPPTRRAARVMTIHDLTVVRYPELCDGPTLAFPGLIRRAVAEGAWVHTDSATIAAEVAREFGVDPERIRTVSPGIPPLSGPREPADESSADESPADRSPAGWAGGRGSPVVLPDGCRRYVLAIGTIEPRKDYPLLVEAFAAVAARIPDLALVVVGGEGWGADRFLAAVNSSPARERIVRTGYLDDAALSAVLAHAAVLAYPSKYEGFGFPPLQAMAAGVPVVATAAGAVPEVVGDGALLVQPGDVDGLAERLVAAVQGGPEIEALVERGRIRSSSFTWERCAAGLAALYAEAYADR